MTPQPKLTELCEVKVRVLTDHFTGLDYCRNVCSGFDEDNCPYGKYKRLGNSAPVRKGRVAYTLWRGE